MYVFLRASGISLGLGWVGYVITRATQTWTQNFCEPIVQGVDLVGIGSK